MTFDCIDSSQMKAARLPVTQTDAATAPRSRDWNLIQRPRITDGALEAIKWLALGCMALDHANKYLLAERVSWVFGLGRIAMPLFAFSLAYNLSRPGASAAGVHHRTMKRLALYGAIATPFFMALGGLLFGWWPLNIMFMLLVATGVTYLIEKRTPVHVLAAAALFVVGGAFVEFWWFGLTFFLAAWRYCKAPSATALLIWTAAAASLYVVNRNLWAVAAIPIILVAQVVAPGVPRFRRAFYAFYPAHLALLFIVQTAM